MIVAKSSAAPADLITQNSELKMGPDRGSQWFCTFSKLPLSYFCFLPPRKGAAALNFEVVVKLEWQDLTSLSAVVR